MNRAWLLLAIAILFCLLLVNSDFAPESGVQAQDNATVNLEPKAFQPNPLTKSPDFKRSGVKVDPISTFAYYYIWFAENSWRRAKSDYPQLGRYSSDDIAVMRQHIQWAKAAGIDGFIVSWKSTPALDRRLEKLVKVATEESFYLVIIYQGLDFQRQPIAIEKIAADLDIFINRYGRHPIFQYFGHPVVIWSGTWRFDRESIAKVTDERRQWLQILASERNLAGYMRLSDLVDGNAYYWSSGDPLRTPLYAEKLKLFGEAIHTKGGLWIAPVAVGFDAQLLGGTRLVPRRNGETLRQAWAYALRSSPDMIGLISWNEFSENSHVEPSENFGRFYLDLLKSVEQVRVPALLNFASDEDATLPTNSDSILNPQSSDSLLSNNLLYKGASPNTVVVLWGSQVHSLQLGYEWQQFLATWGWVDTLYLDLNRIGSILFLLAIITTSLIITIRRRFCTLLWQDL